MFNSKMVVAAACVGFLLSFFTGLFSGIGFGLVLLRAIIFAVLLAGLFIVIKIVFERFLDLGEFENNSTPNNVGVGTMVDVTVGDDELTEEDSAPGFYVDAKLSPKTTEEKISKENENNIIVPTESLESTTQNKVEDEIPSVQNNGFVKSDIQSMTSTRNISDVDETSDEDLDDLPEFNSGTKNTSSFGDSSLKGGTSFMDTGTQDAENIAKAIRTILSKDG